MNINTLESHIKVAKHSESVRAKSDVLKSQYIQMLETITDSIHELGMCYVKSTSLYGVQEIQIDVSEGEVYDYIRPHAFLNLMKKHSYNIDIIYDLVISYFKLERNEDRTIKKYSLDELYDHLAKNSITTYVDDTLETLYYWYMYNVGVEYLRRKYNNTNACMFELEHLCLHDAMVQYIKDKHDEFDYKNYVDETVTILDCFPGHLF